MMINFVFCYLLNKTSSDHEQKYPLFLGTRIYF
ncbi:hypothetical protein MANES_13G072901v8 [Manihot esculenta]|uniref:Uncharacterized protein n=1 Tax=Manihot esculenta TaxID=3983 RepID=A0ACB7GMD3_MANES|nr:hypothetical protein MANES_13G072901v8 [Manihot esculenta]